MATTAFDHRSVTRPDPALMRYYLIGSIFTGPAMPLVILPLWLRYATLRYRFDDEGVRMSWGVLFKREINLTYRRIQDIHVTRGLLQRWMGLASVAVQTASGSATPEMTIEGVLDPDGLRDFLYERMRGARGLPEGGDHDAAEGSHAASAVGVGAGRDEALALLGEIRDGVERLRERVESLERRAGEGGAS